MKIIILLIIINCTLLIMGIHSFGTNCYSQWVQQTSGTNAGLTDVKFINKTTGWVCGFGGTILKTTNAGQNWITQGSGVTEALYDIHPVDSQVVYCVGVFETILKTTDGGNNWLIIRGNVNPGKFFYGMYFLNRNTGWICGTGSWILRTIDGGITFDSTYLTSTKYDIYFKDNLNGLAWGQGGTFYKSSNGGINWNQISVLGEGAEFFEMSIIGDIGWLIGTQNRKVYKTTNFGASWDSLSRITGTSSWLGSIFFSSINSGWVCGDSGKVYKTTNGGFNWYKQVVPLTVGYGPSFFVTDSIGWTIGSIGTIIYTTMGGQIVNINNEITETPINNRLYPCYPNPFNSSTVIKYELTKRSKIKIIIYDVLGKEIKVIIDDMSNSGIHKINFNSLNISSGIYFYKLIVDERVINTKKMLIIK